jgi:hypothetical protein
MGGSYSPSEFLCICQISFFDELPLSEKALMSRKMANRFFFSCSAWISIHSFCLCWILARIRYSCVKRGCEGCSMSPYFGSISSMILSNCFWASCQRFSIFISRFLRCSALVRLMALSTGVILVLVDRVPTLFVEFETLLVPMLVPLDEQSTLSGNISTSPEISASL